MNEENRQNGNIHGGLLYAADVGVYMYLNVCLR